MHKTNGNEDVLSSTTNKNHNCLILNMNNSNCQQCDACLEADLKGLSHFQRVEQDLTCLAQKPIQEIFPAASPSKLEKLEALIKDGKRLKSRPRKKARTSHESEELGGGEICGKCDVLEEICPCARA